MNANGNIIVFHNNSSFKAAIFKLTGVTEAVSVITMPSMSFDSHSNLDFIPLTSNKTLVIAGASNSSAYANILTDTSGTASRGTELPIPANSLSFYNGSFILRNPTSLSAINVLLQNSNSLGSTTRIVLDCTGSSPVFVSHKAIATKVTGSPYLIPYNSTSTEYRYGYNLQIGSTTISLMGSFGMYPSSDAVYGENDYAAFRSLPYFPTSGDKLPTQGFGDNESWFYSSTTKASTIFKIEGVL
jgi:hypothetical protein